MKIYKKNNKIMIEIPFYSKRFNPYMVNENGEPDDVGEYPTLTGLITKDRDGNDEMGFCKTIDMAYKDKGDQFTEIMIQYWGSEEDFKKLCRELGINVLCI